ncbi:MAG: T9SS type A sorting domain-containing protein [Bacteroidota bacterium]
MRPILSLLVCVLGSAAASPSQAQVLVGAGGSEIDRAWCVASDGQGGAFVGGLFRGTASFGSNGPVELESLGFADGFLARYDASGDLVFAVRVAGGTGFEDAVDGIVPDGSSGVFATGYFSGAADFDGDDEPDLTSTGNADAFLARYDATGALTFLLRVGGTGNDLSRGIALDGEGGVLIAGSFSRSIDLDADGTADLTSNGSNDLFVARYDASGQLVFGANAGGAFAGDFAEDVASDGAGGAILTGTIQGAADFDGDGVADLTAAGAPDTFVARYDAAGQFVFTTGIQSTGPDEGRAVAPDGQGGAYVTGDFSGSADADGDGSPDLVSSGISDAFLARYDASGSLVFATRIGGTGADEGFGLAPDGTGGVLATGFFRNAADFDDNGSADLVSAGDEDVFVARYDGTGSLLSASRAGGIGADRGRGIVADGAGGAFVVGSFSGSADFDDDGTADLTSAGRQDAFLAQYGMLSVDAEASPDSGSMRLAVAPNPLRESGTVSLFLEAPATARIALFDAMGRRVTSVHEGLLASGRHEIELDTRALPAGVYILRATAGADRVTRRVTVVR